MGRSDPPFSACSLADEDDGWVTAALVDQATAAQHAQAADLIRLDVAKVSASLRSRVESTE